MRRRNAGKIGRNDACPCGSGRKYKRCCLQASEAGPPLEVPRREAQVPALGVETVQMAIHRLRAMLEDPDGPLGALRFGDSEFYAAVSEHMPSIQPGLGPDEEEDEPVWERLLYRCAPDLLDRAWRARSRAALDGALASALLSSEDRLALGVALATSSREGASHPGLLELALFPLQLQEIATVGASLDDVVQQLTEDVGPEAFVQGVDSLHERHLGLWQRAEGLIARNPAARAAAEAGLDQMLGAAQEILDGPDAPEILTMDEAYVLVAAGLRLQTDAGADTRIEDQVDPEVWRAIGRRCAVRLTAAATPEERRTWGAMVMAARARPALFFLALTHLRIAYRDPEEQALTEQIGGRSELEAYRPWLDWLRARGEGAAADRAHEAIRIVRERLGEQHGAAAVR